MVTSGASSVTLTGVRSNAIRRQRSRSRAVGGGRSSILACRRANGLTGAAVTSCRDSGLERLVGIMGAVVAFGIGEPLGRGLEQVYGYRMPEQMRTNRPADGDGEEVEALLHGSCRYQQVLRNWLVDTIDRLNLEPNGKRDSKGQKSVYLFVHRSFILLVDGDSTA
jgi:hypothetical protein